MDEKNIDDASSIRFTLLESSNKHRAIEVFKELLGLIKRRPQLFFNARNKIERIKAKFRKENKGTSESFKINPFYRELIPEGLEVYSSHLKKYGRIDFGGWNYSLHKYCTLDLTLRMQPYLQEIYSLSKALFIGFTLWDKGIKKYDDWCKHLRQQLSPEELWSTKVTTHWLYDFVERSSEEQVFNESEAELDGTLKDHAAKKQPSKNSVNRKQKIGILFGIGIILLMLSVPPWIARNGKPRDYHFIMSPPRNVAAIDITRLLVQCVFVTLLTGGVVYALQNRKK